VHKKLGVILLSTAILSACGSGGSAPPAPDPDPIEMNTQVIAVSENSSGSLSYSSVFSDLVFEITEANPADIGSVVVEDNTLAITAGETDRPGVINGVLYSQERGMGDGSSKSVSIVVTNDSAVPVLEQVSDLLEQRSDVLNLSEDAAVFQFVMDASYLSSLVNSEQKEAFVSGFDPVTSASFAPAAVAIDDLQSVFDSYNSGNTSDSAVISALDQASSAISSHGQYAANELTDIQTYADVFFGDLSQTDLTYDSESGRYSRYLGQLSMGTYDQQSWQFSPNYELLTPLVAQQLSDDLLVCEAP